MEKAVITVEGLLWLLGEITLIGGATAVISRWVTPWRKLKERLTALENDFKALKDYQNCDHAELNKVEVGIEKICKCTLAITEHQLTGNGDEKLRRAKDEMEDYLIHK